MPVNYKTLWNKLTKKPEPIVGMVDEVQDFKTESLKPGRHSVDQHENVVLIEINARWPGVWQWTVGNVGGTRFSLADAVSSALNTLRVLCDGEVNLPYMIKISKLED